MKIRATKFFGVTEPLTDSRRRRRARGLTGSRSAGLAISFVAHAVAAVTIGAGFRGSSQRGADRHELVVIDLAAPPIVAAPPVVVSPVPAVPDRRAGSPSAARSRSRARRVSTAAGTESAAPVEATEAPVPRFVMTAGTIATRPAAGPPTAPPAPAGGGGGTEPVAGERDVDAPARLLASSPLVYPQAARQAAIEIDFPVEIIVDLDGRVISARPLRRGGYGLDEAAIRAIRAYRFSPALRGGHPVRVRMRWTVQFRLQ